MGAMLFRPHQAKVIAAMGRSYAPRSNAIE